MHAVYGLAYFYKVSNMLEFKTYCCRNCYMNNRSVSNVNSSKINYPFIELFSTYSVVFTCHTINTVNTIQIISIIKSATSNIHKSN